MVPLGAGPTDPTPPLAPPLPLPLPLQIYNEQIKDLLIPSGHLSMRDDRGNLVVHGLSLHKVRLWGTCVSVLCVE